MNDTRKNDSHEPGQACSFKPPQGGVITPILLMNDEGTVVKSLIPSQMANKGQHGFLSPPVWLLQKASLPTVLSRHWLLLQSHPSPSPRRARLSSARILFHSLLPGQIHSEVLCISDSPTGDSSLEPPFLFCELLEFSTYLSYSKQPSLQRAQPSTVPDSKQQLINLSRHSHLHKH